MKENEKKKNYLNTTFNNFNIKKEAMDFSSKLDELNKKEDNDIKLIATCFLPSHLKNNEDLLLNFNIKNPNSNNKNIKYPSTKKNKDEIIKLYRDFKKNKHKFDRTMLISLNKNNIINDRNIKNKLYPKLMKENLHKTLSIGKSEKIIKPNKEKIKKLIHNKTNILMNFNNKNKPFTNLIVNKFKNYNNKKNNEINNFSLQNSNSKSPINKYYITAENFSTLPNVKNTNEINNYLYKSKFKKFNSTSQSKSFSIRHRNYKMLDKIKNNLLDNTNDDSLEEKRKKMKNLYKKNNKPRINLTYLELKKIENSLNSEYINNFMDIKNNNKNIKKIKEKCQTILKEFDKKNNMQIQEIMKEINNQLLGVGFSEFYNYLLTILKNYDKKVIDYAFEIVDDKKECPEELKFKNVKQRHQQFKRLLEKQFISNINANKHLDNLIKNSKSKMGFNNNNYYNDKIGFNITHNNIKRNDIIENILNKNNYRSKFFELFKKIK